MVVHSCLLYGSQMVVTRLGRYDAIGLSATITTIAVGLTVERLVSYQQ